MTDEGKGWDTHFKTIEHKKQWILSCPCFLCSDFTVLFKKDKRFEAEKSTKKCNRCWEPEQKHTFFYSEFLNTKGGNITSAF